MKVKVWNNNTVEWKEKFKGEDIVIPSKGYIEMEFYEAHEFKGQFAPIKIKGDGTQDPTSFKMIKVDALKQEEKDELEEEGQEVYPCNLCKKVYSTEGALVKHSEAQHAEAMVTDFEAEKQVPAKKRGRPAKTTGVEVNG